MKGKYYYYGDTSHVTLNPIALTNKVIKVVASYFCGGVYQLFSTAPQLNSLNRNFFLKLAVPHNAVYFISQA